MHIHPVGILNSPLLTEDGLYRGRNVSIPEARELLRRTAIDSALGHQSTADLLSTLVGRPVRKNRENLFRQAPGQHALAISAPKRLNEGEVLDEARLWELGVRLTLITRLE